MNIFAYKIVAKNHKAAIELVGKALFMACSVMLYNRSSDCHASCLILILVIYLSKQKYKFLYLMSNYLYKCILKFDFNCFIT